MKKRSRKVNPARVLQNLTVEWLAEKLCIPASQLWWRARRPEIMYWDTRPQKKQRGGYREIDAPKKQYKSLLRKMGRVLSAHISLHPAAHGGVVGRSSFTSAAKHRRGNMLATRDIANCYPSIGQEKLFAVFCRLGSSVSFAKFLAGIMTLRDRMPQGGPLSCLALNLFLLPLDDLFSRRARQLGGEYTRLSDDFVISTDNRKDAIRFGRELDNAIFAQGLTGRIQLPSVTRGCATLRD